MTPLDHRNARVFAVAQARWEEPPDDLPECECCRPDCDYLHCRFEHPARCHGCDGWCEQADLIQYPDPDYPAGMMVCPECIAAP